MFAKLAPIPVSDTGRTPRSTGIDGLRHICSPPLRSSAENHQDNLWMGLRTDDLSVVATDHCPFCDAEKLLGAEGFQGYTERLRSH